MSEVRKMVLYRNNSDGSVTHIDSIMYNHTTLAYERQLGDDLAAKHNYRQGDGFVSIIDPKTNTGIDSMGLQP